MTESFQLIILLNLGFILGLKHSLDADHVVAVSTIVSHTGSLKKSALAGLAWGIGHTFTLLLAGFVILSFGLDMPDRLNSVFEFLVGVLLVILGIDVLRKIVRDKFHLHEHGHKGITHTHLHSHRESPFHSHAHRSFFVGMTHGLAGSAGLMLLILATVKSVIRGLLYIMIYGLGSISGMLLVSIAIKLPFLLSKKFDRVNISIKILAGTISIFLGFIIMYEIGYVKGLFF